MKLLIAEDDPISRRLLERLLLKWGYEVVLAEDGDRAWEELRRPDGPRLAILDWMMPGIDGVELCRRVKAEKGIGSAYLIMLTARGRSEDTVAGLRAGADDYVTKPFDHEELRARVQVGARVMELQLALAGRVSELESALADVRTLQGLLPICSYCKRIRDDRSYWHQVEVYVTDHSRARFSHGICPDCYGKYVAPEVDKLGRD